MFCPMVADPSWTPNLGPTGLSFVDMRTSCHGLCQQDTTTSVYAGPHICQRRDPYVSVPGADDFRPAFRACTYWHHSSTPATDPPSTGRHRFSGFSIATPSTTNTIPCARPSFTHF